MTAHGDRAPSSPPRAAEPAAQQASVPSLGAAARNDAVALLRLADLDAELDRRRQSIAGLLEPLDRQRSDLAALAEPIEADRPQASAQGNGEILEARRRRLLRNQGTYAEFAKARLSAEEGLYIAERICGPHFSGRARFGVTAPGPGHHDASIVDRLIEALAKGSDARRRRNAAKALGQCGPLARHAVYDLAAALRDPGAGVRWHSARSRGRTGPAALSAVSDLASALGDSVGLVRTAAAETPAAVWTAMLPPDPPPARVGGKS